MIVKVAPMGERVVEVTVEDGTTVGEILEIARVIHNERSIRVNNVDADLDTIVHNHTSEATIITLANKSKGGK
jgi:hypothetical protein